MISGRVKTRPPARPLIADLLLCKYPARPGQVVLHCVGEHDPEPEKARDRSQPNELRTPADMHEKQHDAGHLCERYQQCDERIRTRKHPVKIDRGDKIRRDGPDDENSENAEISRYPNM